MKYLKKLLLLLGIMISCFSIYLTFNHYTYKFSHTGDVKDGNPVVSPNGDYAAQIYYDNYGGAAGGVNFIVNVIEIYTGEERTIYFSDAKGANFVQWTSNSTLAISNVNEYHNHSVELTVGKEVYDENGGACKAYQVKKHDTCFSKDTYRGDKQ